MGFPILVALLAAPPLAERLVPPDGYARLPAEEKSFGAWLREAPVKPGRPDVMLFDGRKKENQDAQWLVLDFDVGKRDLQQCADAVMRLFAEWQWATDRKQSICFRYSSGDRLAWPKWESGYRPRVRGNQVSLVKNARIDHSYDNFRRYLESVFLYAGSFSLSRDLVPAELTDIRPGDVFVHGGFPGHAAIVIDVVENQKGQRMFALAQSYMPAQDIHVLKNPAAEGPWYAAQNRGQLVTPEWTFEWTELMRFRESACD